jgi:hypothetical protein
MRVSVTGCPDAIGAGGSSKGETAQPRTHLPGHGSLGPPTLYPGPAPEECTLSPVWRPGSGPRAGLPDCSLVGEVPLERPYLSSLECKLRFYPLDEVLELAECGNQWDIQEVGVRLAADKPQNSGLC